jgi:hypothetical protein
MDGSIGGVIGFIEDISERKAGVLPPLTDMGLKSRRK